jgi:hypothetical protein
MSRARVVCGQTRKLSEQFALRYANPLLGRVAFDAVWGEVPSRVSNLLQGPLPARCKNGKQRNAPLSLYSRRSI